MSKTLTKEPMDYKSQIKKSILAELLAKIRIIRLVKKKNRTQSETAKKFGCHRNTIGNIIRKFESLDKDKRKMLLVKSLNEKEIRKLMKPLKNKLRVPKTNSRSATKKQEDKIEEIFKDKQIRVGPYEMKTILNRKYGQESNRDNYDKFSKLEKSLADLKIGVIKGTYKRKGLKTKKKRSASGNYSPVYDYAALACFEKVHMDTKEITDLKALPEDIYEKFKNNLNLPIHQYTFLDAKSRFRFFAYSRHLTSEFGLKFMLFTIQFVRAITNNWNRHIRIGVDSGREFCGGSIKKEKQWNNYLRRLNASFYSYNKGYDKRKNIIERSHKTDDRSFYIPKGENIKGKRSFLKEARGWFLYYNQKGHTGKAMNERSPLEVIEDNKLSNAKKLLRFPTMILEDNIQLLREHTDYLIYDKELRDYEDKHNEKPSTKTKIDLKTKYSFFNKQFAQNVFTYYQNLVISEKALFRPIYSFYYI